MFTYDYHEQQVQNSYGFGCCETCAKITGNRCKTHMALAVVKLAQK